MLSSLRDLLKWRSSLALIVLLAAFACSIDVGIAALPVLASDVDRAVVAAVESSGVKQVTIVAHVDLTQPFGTDSPWTLIVARNDGPLPEGVMEWQDHGPLIICFVHNISPDCSEKLYKVHGDEQDWFGTPFDLRDSRVVYGGEGNTHPILLLKTCGAFSGDGNCGIATALYDYDRTTDRFFKTFLNVTGRNGNQVTRFVETGPLRGDVIVDYPTDNAPYSYWIEVFRLGSSKQYSQILRYRGHTHYGDGNTLAVPDSEMPEILRRLGLWKPGDLLPIPSGKAGDCRHPVLRNQEEWCN